MANKLKKGDEVKVLVGKDKGKVGKITRVIPGEKKVVVSGVAVVKRHTKATQENPKGSIINKEMPFDWSKVAYIKDGQKVKIGFKVLENGKKVRYDRRTGSQIDQ